METYRLVMPEHLNHFGFLFGGYLLQWVDEVSFIATTMAYPGCRFVTIGMDEVEFKKSVREGTILKFQVDCIDRGTTSVKCQVEVNREDIESGIVESIFTTTVTFVRIDNSGIKQKLPPEKGKQNE